MSILSNQIELFIKSLLQNGIADLQRNELAEQFHCAPSQINYVLTTRFSVEKGYVVSSRRGGGGGIRIVKIDVDQNDYLFDIINGRLREEISFLQARRIVDGLKSTGIIGEVQSRMILAAVSDKTLSGFCDEPNVLRANILKQILVAMLYEE
jgi:transcriptional regulator CtsR